MTVRVFSRKCDPCCHADIILVPLDYVDYASLYSSSQDVSVTIMSVAELSSDSTSNVLFAQVLKDEILFEWNSIHSLSHSNETLNVIFLM